MLLRCESLEPPMSQLGQSRPLRRVCAESVVPPTSDIGRRGQHGSSVPEAVTCTATSETYWLAIQLSLRRWQAVYAAP
jgi:hypothetical protein